MNWLFPAVIATLVGTVILALAFFYLHHAERKPYLRIWAWGWVLYALRFVMMLGLQFVSSPGWRTGLLAANQLFALASGVLLLAGTYAFKGEKISRAWAVPSLAMALWVCGSAGINLPLFAVSLPTFLFLGAINIRIGMMLLTDRGKTMGIQRATGYAFIIWGIHKADYPFLRGVAWFAPWGYLLGATLEILVAVGMVLNHFQAAKNEYLESEQRYRSLVDTMQEGLGILDRNGVLTYVNDRVCHMLEYPREAILGRSVYDFLDEENRAELHRHLEARRQGKESTYALVWQKKSGEKLEALMSPKVLYDENNQFDGSFAVITDITHLKQAQASLRDRETQLNAIFNAASNVSFIITDARDPEPKILEFSPGAEKIFGHSRKDMIGTPVSVVHLPEDVARFPEAHRTLREGRTAFGGEATLVRRSGEQFPALFSAYPLIDDTGHMYAALGVSIDISEQKRLEAQLKQSHKMEAIGTLAGGIAHDFNNILSIIIGNIELALDDLPWANPARLNIKEARTAGLRAKEVVRQLLSFTRKAERERTVLPIAPVIKDALKLIRATLAPTIEIKTDIPDHKVTISANVTQLNQILINLCTNAAHAMEDRGGTLLVSLTPVNGGAAHGNPLADLPEGRYVRLSVSDTGPGIPPDILPRIFDPYFTTKEIGKGTGMGLSTVHGIVKNHDGLISVDSETGQGTTIHVFFPSTETTAQG